MRNTKKLTLSAMMVALGTVFLLVGANIEALDLAMGAVASVVMVFVHIELGSPYTWLVWLSTATLALLLGTANPLSGAWYLALFGIWPILKGYVERLPRVIWLLPKLLFANLSFAAVIGTWVLIFKISPFAIDAAWLKIAALIVGNLAFIIYDLFVSAVARVYLLKYKDKFSKLLK